jgi:hypothetical protein
MPLIVSFFLKRKKEKRQKTKFLCRSLSSLMEVFILMHGTSFCHKMPLLLLVLLFVSTQLIVAVGVGDSPRGKGTNVLFLSLSPYGGFHFSMHALFFFVIRCHCYLSVLLFISTLLIVATGQ